MSSKRKLSSDYVDERSVGVSGRHLGLAPDPSHREHVAESIIGSIRSGDAELSLLPAEYSH